MVAGTTTTIQFQIMCGCNIGPLFWQQWGWRQHWCVHSLVLWLSLDLLNLLCWSDSAVMLIHLQRCIVLNNNIDDIMMLILALLFPDWLLTLALVLALAFYIDYDHVGVNHVAFCWLWCSLVLKQVIFCLCGCCYRQWLLLQNIFRQVENPLIFLVVRENKQYYDSFQQKTPGMCNQGRMDAPHPHLSCERAFKVNEHAISYLQKQPFPA